MTSQNVQAPEIASSAELEKATDKLSSMPEKESENDTKSRSEQYLFDFFKPEKNPSSVAVIYEDGRGVSEVISYEQVDYAAKIIECQLRKHSTMGFVGIVFPQNTLYPAIILGVMKAGCAVYNIAGPDWEERMHSLRQLLQMTFLIMQEEEFSIKSDWVLANAKNQEFIEITMSGKTDIVRFVELKKWTNNPEIQSIICREPYEFAYAIDTSGSRGTKKVVLVPHSCIVPNVDDFINKVWQMNQTEVVFGCSPRTFDPSVIELFSAFGCSGKILYVPDVVKLDGLRLGRSLMRNKTTIIQITPSLLRRVGEGLKTEGFFEATKTSLKALALGGERCLLKAELKSLISADMFARLQSLTNLYGLTEISCWASYHNINLHDSSPICIGQPLSETQILTGRGKENEIGGFDEIQISSSTRVCTVLNHRGEVMSSRWVQGESFQIDSFRNTTCKHYTLNTGDYGHLYDELQLGVCYIGRFDRIVKRNGMKVPLVAIEEMAMQSKMIHTAECVVWEDKIYLVVVLKEISHTLLGLGRKVRAKLIPGLYLEMSPNLYPDCVVGVHSIPLNASGKIDMISILKYVQENVYTWPGCYSIGKDTVIESVFQLWLHATRNYQQKSCHVSKAKVLKENFFAAGGDSVGAIWFLENAFQTLKLSGSQLQEEMQPILFRKMLVATFASVCHTLVAAIAEKPLTATIGLVSAETILEFKSRPSVKNKIEGATDTMSVGTEASFALKSKVLHLDTVIPLYQQSCQSPLRTLTSSEVGLRMCIDARVSISVKGQCRGTVIVGSHSGHLIAVDLLELRLLIENRDRKAFSGGSILWSIFLPGRVETEVVYNEEFSFIYLGCHNARVYKVATLDGSLCGHFACKGAIRSKPALDSENRYLVVVDDCNMVYCLNERNLTLVWKKKILGGLVSTSSPACVPGMVYITTISSGLIALSGKDGRIVWPENGIEVNAITSPTVVNHVSGQQVVFATTNGAEGRNVNTGEVIWKYHEVGIWGSVAPFTPQIHSCIYVPKLEIIITSRTGKIVRLNSSGQKLTEIICGSPDFPSVVICTRNYLDEQIECFLVNKPSTRDAFGLINLKDLKSEIPDIGMKMNYKVFAPPNSYNEFLIFGGRDNNLHLITFNQLSTEDFPYLRND